MEEIVISIFLCNLLVACFCGLCLLGIVLGIQSAIQSHKSEKRSVQLDAERMKCEKEHAIHEAEYHAARMKELESK